MKTLKEMIDDNRQMFVNDLFAAIVKFEENTGAKIKRVSYKESSYCKFREPTAVLFELTTELQ